MIAFSLQVRGIVDDLVNDFLNLQFPEAVPMMEKDAYQYVVPGTCTYTVKQGFSEHAYNELMFTAK